MTDDQLDELDRQIEAVLLNHLYYLDIGNPVIPEVIHSAKEDIKDVVDSFVEKYINYLYRNKKDVREIIVMGKSAIGTKLKKLYIKKI